MGTLLSKALLPKIDFHDVQSAWFNYAGRAYPVISAPPDVFKSAVQQKAPHWRLDDEYGPLLKQDELDIYDRWYLLCGLAESHRAISLYESRESAEQTCREQVAG